jgi:hypothetical protein
MSAAPPEAVLRPGPEGWELWKATGKEGFQLVEDGDTGEGAVRRNTLLLLPTRSLLAVPLWISAQGDAREIAELELDSRHLLKKDAEVSTVRIFERAGRALILAIAAVDDSESLPRLGKSAQFGFPAESLPGEDVDAVVWKEFGEVCFAFFREGRCVFFTASGESVLTPSLGGAIARAGWRLKFEGVVDREPATAKVVGDFPPDARAMLGETLRAEIRLVDRMPPPLAAGNGSSVFSPTAHAIVTRRERLRKLGLFGIGTLAAYAMVIALLGAEWFIQRSRLEALTLEAASVEPASAEARRIVGEWRELRPAIDPGLFGIDMLDAVASALPSEQARITLFDFDEGVLTISGEASSLEEANAFFENIKQNNLLSEYEWTTRQPQLAGRNKVRFEMEGTLPGASLDEE